MHVSGWSWSLLCLKVNHDHFDIVQYLTLPGNDVCRRDSHALQLVLQLSPCTCNMFIMPCIFTFGSCYTGESRDGNR